MTVHLVGLPHTPFVAEQAYSCAYTTKAINYLKVLQAAGESVVVYWGGKTKTKDLSGATYVGLSSNAVQDKEFGHFDPTAQPSITWGADEPRWMRHCAAAIEMLDGMAQKGDVIALWTGTPLAAVGRWARERGFAVVEPAVGYDGVDFGNWQAYESSAWMHTVYAKYGVAQGRWFDRVIPGYADPTQFRVLPKDPKPYVLFVGRVMTNKGPQIGESIAEALGMRYVVAGTGAWPNEEGHIVGNGVVLKNAEFAGPVNPAQRAELMGKAALVVVPTMYIEPFGTVHIEAQMAGTPVLTSGWGAFRETVPQLVGAEMFHSIPDAVRKAHQLFDVEPAEIRERAVNRFSPVAVSDATAEWLDDVRRTVDGRGFYGS